MCLFGDPARNDLAGRDIQRNLAGREQEVARPDRLAVWTDGAGRVGCRNTRRTCSGLGDLGDLVRPDAPGAGVDSTVAAADPGPDPLQVRLEPARPDVMGVAELPADDRGLSTDFAMLCHVGCNPSADLTAGGVRHARKRPSIANSWGFWPARNRNRPQARPRRHRGTMT